MLLSSAAPENLPPPAAGADEIRKGADEILRRPEFQEPAKSLYQRALDEIGKRLTEVLQLLVNGGRGALLAWLVLAIVVAGVAYLVVRGVRRDGRRGRRRRDEHVDVDPRRPAADWAAEASRFEAAGAWRDALRCRYRALIAGLAGAGVVEEVPGTTAGEYRVLVRAARPAVADPIAGATDLFERAWYGNETTGPSEAAAFQELAGRVLTGASP